MPTPNNHETLNVHTCPRFDIKPSYHYGSHGPAGGQKLEAL